MFGCGWCSVTGACQSTSTTTTCSGSLITTAKSCATCNIISNCDACASTFACGWCNATNRCLSSVEAAFVCNGAIYAFTECAPGPTIDPSSTTPGPCVRNAACSTCIAESGCDWCETTRRCTFAFSIEPCAGGKINQLNECPATQLVKLELIYNFRGYFLLTISR